MVRARTIAFLCSLLCAVGFVTASPSVSAPPQTTDRSAQQIRITADDIARLPVGKHYLVDLTRRGVIYDFDSTGRPIDFTRVKVHTAAGDVAIDTWLKGKLPSTAIRWRAGHLRLGHAKEFSSFYVRGPRSPALGFTCDGARCDCKGDDDCNDMFSSGVCGDIAACTPDGCSCLRL